ncbi:MAG: TM0106 family RecB-like putative nuclease [Sulfuritalea sp.]|nr:TM0106 family RecB-like putative nuclease [Sulfuritalea sp.]
MEISSEIFEANLKCPTKCWLRANGEQFAGNAYARWVITQSDTYRAISLKQLEAKSLSGELVGSPFIASVLASTWRNADGISLRVASNSLALRSDLHALERLPPRINGESASIVPIRFVFTNKLGKAEKMLLGFDALVLSKSLGQEIKTGKIIHGDHADTTRIDVATFFDDIKIDIAKITALLSSPSPPDLVLNRHCTECEFQNRCRQKATETDDLSLLSGMSEKERARHRSKGIFTIAQLSYTFRPRRTPKRAKNPAKPRYFALQALALREKCIYIHGTPEIAGSKCQIFLDIEGLPDRDFYYLIGALVVSEHRESFHSFWANTESDSQKIFTQFADLADQSGDYRIFHYGDYDSTAIKRVASGMTKDAQERFDQILQKSVNVLSLVFPHVYFPSYSNSLKEIARFFSADLTAHDTTGLDSIIWRTEWERTNNHSLRTQLIEYNRSDCIALRELTAYLCTRTFMGGSGAEGIVTRSSDDMRTAHPRWQLFGPKPHAVDDFKEIIKSAYFDYQREKVLVRTDACLKAISKKTPKGVSWLEKPTRTIVVTSTRCQDCRSRKLKLQTKSESSRMELDIRYSRNGVRKCVTRYVSWRYQCERCGKHFRSEERIPRPSRYGHGFVSWCVYQNAVAGVAMHQVRKSLVDVFGATVDHSALHRAKERIATFYESLYGEVLDRILASPVLHIDETPVTLRKVSGYVWVLTSFDAVYYLYRQTREADFLREMLVPFRGVLVSDFFTGYDSLPCEQQKCLIHLVRDIDDDLLRNPFDEELKRLGQRFGILLRSIVNTVDLFGLKCRHLKKHKKEVDKFIANEAAIDFSSELARKYGGRLVKYGPKMFTFLSHDGVPWNNNNAEHAIKRFARYRRDADGRYSERTLRDYLVIASTFETCEFNKLNVLKFLLSQERTLDGLLRMAGQKRKMREPPVTGTPSVTASLSLC